MFKRVATIAGIMTLAGSSLLADFSYQQTSTITGGAMMSMMRIAGAFSKKAREPIQSTVAIKGDRMVHRTSDNASVIDLGSGTITNIDFQKKQYSVMTFEEMKQMMEQLQQKAQKGQKGEQAQMKFKVSANATGKTKQVAGLEAKEMIMKMEMEAADPESKQKGGMSVTTDMWVAPGVAGYREVSEFQKRMAEKLNWNPGGNMFMSDPKVSQGMAEVAKEIAKLDGMPVQQFVTMGMAGQPGTAGADGSTEPAQQQRQPQQQQQVERPSAGGVLGGALGSRLGGLGGLGRKKPPAEKPAEQPAAQPADAPAAGGQASGTPGSLLEMTTEMSNFSAGAVDASQFEVPAGFKKVESDFKKMK